MIRKLNSFLKTSKASSLDKNSIFVVLGNQSGDLDSLVSSLLYAFQLYENKVENNVKIVFNIPRHHFRLRRDAEYLFNSLGIDITSVIFAPEFPFRVLHDERRLQLCLIDHNQLCDQQKLYRNDVMEIIDHHDYVEEYKSASVVVEKVGSTCTLITERLSESILQDVDVCRLCLAPILLDTANLDSTKRKFSQKDVDMVNNLMMRINMQSREEYFNILLQKRNDVSNFTVMMLLEKDYKDFWSNGLQGLVVISSIPRSVEHILLHIDLKEQIGKFSIARSAKLGAVMCAYEDSETKLLCRELIVYSWDEDLLQMTTSALCSYKYDLNLHKLALVIPSDSGFIHLQVFKQENVLSSRKQVLPILQNILR